MESSGILVTLFSLIIIGCILAGIIYAAYYVYRKNAREQKNYERSLKMVQILIHLPPSSDDKDDKGRDQRDVNDELISNAQRMYDVIASTATRGFHSRLYGQRHISFEIVASGGLIHYYVAVPYLLVDSIKQAILAAYPTARLEEVEEINVFSKAGKISGTLGGEMRLKREYIYPIYTFKDSKTDAMGGILNAMTQAQRGDGVGIQILLRPAHDNWSKQIDKRVQGMRDNKKSGGDAALEYAGQIMEALWKPPELQKKEQNGEPKKLTGNQQAQIDAMEEKARHSGFETLIRIVVSTPSSARSHQLLTGVQAAFAQFNSAIGNGFKFEPATNIENFVTDYIMRFFPAERRSDILNTVELATVFHLPTSTDIPSQQVERQMFREVDGPTQEMTEGNLLGFNVFRGVRKAIRISDEDRLRHVYVMGSTGMGKSVFLERQALQDMQRGRGFAVIDPHGDLVEGILGLVPENRIQDVIYFNPADMEHPIGLNLFEVSPDDPDPEQTKDYIISETINMFYSLYDPNHQGIVGPRMANIVRYASLLAMAGPDGGTFMDIPKILNDPEYAKPRIKYLTNQRAIDFWTKEWPNSQRSNDAGEVTSWVVSKWADFENTMTNNILGQKKSGFDIRDIMDNHKILLVNLSKGKLGEMSSKLLGMVFVMKFQAAAMSRANIPESERQDFTLYVDEFQNFATDSFESILSEARKYRLSLVVANQFMGQLIDKIREAIHGNVGTYIIGRCGTDDVDEVAKMLQPVFQPEDLLFMPNYTAAVKMLIKGVPTKPFSMSLPPLMQRSNPELAQVIAQMSAQRYGRPRAEVEAEIKARWGSSNPVPEKKAAQSVITAKPASGNSFVDNWLKQRKQSARTAGSVQVATAPKSLLSANPVPAQPVTPQAAGRTSQVRPVAMRQASSGISANAGQNSTLRPKATAPTTTPAPAAAPKPTFQPLTNQTQYGGSPAPVRPVQQIVNQPKSMQQPLPPRNTYPSSEQVVRNTQNFAYRAPQQTKAPEVTRDDDSGFTMSFH